MMEFALVLPILFFLLGAIFLAGLATWRQSSADFGVFAVAARAGVYDRPVSVRHTIYWRDVRNNIRVIQVSSERQVVSTIRHTRQGSWMFGLNWQEVFSGRVVSRRWRFYPGPPPKKGWE